MKMLLPAVFLLSSVNVLATEITAPFGFTWGQSQKELENIKVPLTNCSTKNKLTSCKTIKPIKGVTFGEQYRLIIDDEKGLQKITLISKDIASDITGSDGKKLYEKIKSSLTKKYEAPTAYEYIGRELYKEYDEFYQCLKYDGCGSWVAFWEVKNGGNAIVQLKGLSRGKGYLTLTYESKEWGSIVDSLKEREKASDDDAL